jgi:hypothetical protein
MWILCFGKTLAVIVSLLILFQQIIFFAKFLNLRDDGCTLELLREIVLININVQGSLKSSVPQPLGLQ